MQSLTSVQADAILDVLDECHHVRQAWDKCRNRSLVVSEAIEELDVAYIKARDLHVSDKVLLPLIDRNLPSPGIELIHKKGAA